MESAPESPESEAGCGAKWQGLPLRFDRATSSLRTADHLFPSVLELSSVILPKWGMMRGGEFWERTISARLMAGQEPGLLPTPVASEWKDYGTAKMLASIDRGGRLARRICSRTIPSSEIRCSVNPCFSEWLMGWIVGWTDSRPLETGKFQRWLQWHGESFQTESRNDT
jgi:hypothetical protein